MFMHLARAQWQAVSERLAQKIEANPEDKALVKVRDRIQSGMTDQEIVVIEGQVPGFRMLAEWIDAGPLVDVAKVIRWTCAAVDAKDCWDSVDIKMGMANAR